ncbi:hypothetical protein JDV02_003664 [Purpureocillium takamizusanense]|uniref:Integral membrane protein n=1 Tax=Purpureocillium takamizusanense TaxID=2060973 RepID=A0A9Q8QDA1_9HYPO|nr:uncharacterized protein JDV02_003664 [Purpureocillium takamizusanense]UNI17308.1 hypothetical protein JDV02_003664 [Purpureocillium takamizusanense]
MSVAALLRAGASAFAMLTVLSAGKAHATGVDMNMDMGTGEAAGHEQSASQSYPPTYFAHPHYVGVIYAHIALMVIAWVFVLPIAVMLSLARSRYTVASRVLFSMTNAVGIVFSIIYNANTPDLYPNNAHHKIGWIVTSVASAQLIVGMVGHFAGPVRGRRACTSSPESSAFMPIPADLSDEEYRMSNDSGQGTEPDTESLHSNSLSTLDGVGDDNDQHLPLHARHKEYQHDDELVDDISPPSRASSWAANHAVRVISSAAWRYIDLASQIVDRIILPFGFIAFTTGIVTLGRFFEGPGVFGGLAHWVKGGVFFWLGLFTLGRWSGSFGQLGWAWNARPPPVRHQQWSQWRPSAEFVESALILFYGSTNIFLEHLGGWGGEWSAQDLEHMAITVLFIGGGLCGILVESTRIRDLLNTTVTDAPPAETSPDEERQLRIPPTTYGFSLNPIPALVILLLGFMMSSHHQSTMISTMVHKQWGNLLLGASFARGLTYVLVYLRPPKSVLPSRPPTELLASFGLIAGGIIFMASSSDTVDGMIHYDLDAMFMYTVTMGIVGILMAWELVVLAIKGWATRKERQTVPRFAYA